MQYRIFNGTNYQFNHGSDVPKLGYYGSAVVTIDPSKTNCAMVVGDPGGDVISIVEMSGNGWGSGKPIDTTQYCSEVREFITNYLRPAEVYKVGVEQAITKRGMEHHHSNMVLTEIRATLLSLFYEEYGFNKKDVEVNNWSWKRYVLPEGYRSQSEKGSKRYFSQYLGIHDYDNYHEADVTDCLCIYEYIIRDCRNTYRIACRAVEEKHNQYQLAIMPSWADGLQFRSFDFNPSFSVDENARYYANRSKRPGIASISTNRLRLDDIYSYANGFMDTIRSEQVRMVVYV